MAELLKCQDCGGRGIDPGSLHELEPCPVCLGSGKELVELDPRSSHYGRRKPIARALPNPVTAGQIAEREGRYGS